MRGLNDGTRLRHLYELPDRKFTIDWTPLSLTSSQIQKEVFASLRRGKAPGRALTQYIIVSKQLIKRIPEREQSGMYEERPLFYVITRHVYTSALKETKPRVSLIHDDACMRWTYLLELN